LVKPLVTANGVRSLTLGKRLKGKKGGPDPKAGLYQKGWPNLPPLRGLEGRLGMGRKEPCPGKTPEEEVENLEKVCTRQV